jgi:hypothetical protein
MSFFSQYAWFTANQLPYIPPSGVGTIITSSSLPTTCCGQLQAVVFQARVRYANETGRLLLPQASADACIQVRSFCLSLYLLVPTFCECSCKLALKLWRACASLYAGRSQATLMCFSQHQRPEASEYRLLALVCFISKSMIPSSCALWTKLRSS